MLLCVACERKTAREESLSQPNKIQPRIFGITVSNMEQSMEWYTTNLHFERDTVMTFESSGITVGMMHMGDFFIELISFTGSIDKSQLNLPEDYSNLHGFIKIGFQTNNIQSFYDEMLANQVDILAPLDDLPGIPNRIWPDQYFLVTDPDGNYIQFFSNTENSSFQQELYPFLIALSTPDLEASMSWYEQQLGMAPFGEKVGNPGNERALMSLDGFILELGQFEADRSYKNLETPEGVWRSKIHGITKLSFLIDDIQKPYRAMQADSINFDFDLTERKSMAGDRYFMIQDQFGSSLQFFELDK